MKHVTTDRFWKSFRDLPLEVQVLAEQKFRIFGENPNHPSLRTRKMEGKVGIWEGHVTRGYVFTFRYAILDGEKVIESLDIGPHDLVYDRA